jgi:3-phosphoshikimate 1-carboxyvinyltransferase
MHVTIYPSGVAGNLRAPSSKSQTIRAYAAAMLAGGTSVLFRPSACDDAKAMLAIAEKAGAVVKERKLGIAVTGGAQLPAGQVDCGESGLAARIMIALSALSDKEVIITGSSTLMQRTMGDIEQPLHELGVSCSSGNGRLPFRVKGPITGGSVSVDGSSTSQFVTGLLMALPLAGGDSVLTVERLHSIPYLEMTLEVLKKFGIAIERGNDHQFIISGNQRYMPANLKIEGDWSGAAFMMVATAINGDMTISGLNIRSTQSDMAMLTLFREVGIKTRFAGERLSVFRSEIQPFNFDCTHCPDLFPPLVVLAAHARDKCCIKGAERLMNKESDRAKTLTSEFGKLGIKIEVAGNEMIVHPGEIHGGTVSSHNDHRIAMACAVAALSAKTPVTITDAECVAKSYSRFFDDLQKAGAKLDTYE